MIALREQSAWYSEALDLGPILIVLIATLQRYRMRIFGCRIVQPLECFADILTMSVTAGLLPTKLL